MGEYVSTQTLVIHNRADITADLMDYTHQLVTVRLRIGSSFTCVLGTWQQTCSAILCRAGNPEVVSLPYWNLLRFKRILIMSSWLNAHHFPYERGLASPPHFASGIIIYRIAENFRGTFFAASESSSKFVSANYFEIRNPHVVCMRVREGHTYIIIGPCLQQRTVQRQLDSFFSASATRDNDK